MALTKTSHSMLKGDTISVVDFGAVGDGVVDDTSAIQSALNSGKATVLFPKGSYKITSQLVVPFPGPSLIGEEGATLDLTNISGPFPSLAGILFATSSNTSLPALSVAAEAGDEELVFVSAPDVVAGDVIALTDTTSGSYLAPSYNQGEYVYVRSVTGSTVEITESLYGDYPTATTSLRKEPRRQFVMENLTIIGPPESSVSFLIVVQVNYAIDSIIRNCKIYSTSQRTLTLAHCNRMVIENCFINENTATVSDNYGLLFSECQDMTASNCNAFARRHATATGSANYVNRNIQILGGNYQSDVEPAVDAHGGTEYYMVDGATIGGFTIGGNHGFIRNSTIINHRQGGTCCSIRECRGTSFEMRNCFIRTYRYYESASTSAGMGWDALTINSNTVLGGVMVIENNTFYASNAGVAVVNPQPWINVNNGYGGVASSSASDIEVRVANNRMYGNLRPVYMQNQGTGGANFLSLTYHGNDVPSGSPDNTVLNTTNRYENGTVYALSQQVTAESGSVTVAASGIVNIFSPSILSGRVEFYGGIINGTQVRAVLTIDGNMSIDSGTTNVGNVIIPAAVAHKSLQLTLLNLDGASSQTFTYCVYRKGGV